MGIFEEIKKDKNSNFKERIWFIKYWAKYIKTHSDEGWSKGQAVLINSQMQSIKEFYRNLKKTKKGRDIFKRLVKKIYFKTQ